MQCKELGKEQQRLDVVTARETWGNSELVGEYLGNESSHDAPRRVEG